MEIEYFPFEYADNKGNPSGFDVEIATLIAKKLGVKLKINATAYRILKAYIPLAVLYLRLTYPLYCVTQRLEQRMRRRDWFLFRKGCVFSAISV
jgi:ABC-type amino acid transport substrate-binding protein